MLKINGTEITTPKSIEFDLNDIDGETNRNAAGEMIRDRIAVKRKLVCEWPPLTQNEISALLSAVADVFFTLEYPDAIIGVTTKTFYVGDRTAPMYTYINGVAKWQGLKMNFIEK